MGGTDGMNEYLIYYIISLTEKSGCQYLLDLLV